MATITFSVQTAQGTTTATRTISDANAARALAACQISLPGRTSQQLMDYALDRLLRQIIAITKNQEQTAIPVADIPIT